MKYSQIVPLVNKILSQYTMKLTLRQIYYRLVALHNYPNKRSSYNQLSSQLVTAREKGEVDERRIEDRTRRFLLDTTDFISRYSGYGYGGYEKLKDFEDFIRETFLDYWEKYQRDLWQDQEEFVVIWIEKDALSRVVARSGDKYRVITAPSRGYASYTYIRQAISLLPKDKQIIILHFSDHDSSGLDMTRDLETRFYRYSRKNIKVQRVALTYDQVQKYGLDPNPTKTTDTRAANYIDQYGMECWELDAIEPNELQRIVTEAIEQHVNLEQWEKSVKQEADDKRKLEETFDRWRYAIEELEENEEG